METKCESDPLFLTPMLRAGKIDEARKLAKVDGLPGIPGLDSFSGFMTVNKTDNSNMFFWFFPATGGVENAPVHLWLDGGPGVSCFFSLFTGNGPLAVNQEGNLELREMSWTKHHSMIYIDSPIGSGYSFMDNDAGYSTSSRDVAEGVYEFIQQFFILFPEFASAPFYLGGGSYGGHMAPPLARLIHEKNKVGSGSRVNLKEVLLCCPWLDPIHQIEYGPYFYNLGLIDERDLKHFNSECGAMVQDIAQGKCADAKQRWEALLVAPMVSHFAKATGFAQAFNVVDEKANAFAFSFITAVQKPEFRDAIHVGNLPWEFFSQPAHQALNTDFMSSVKSDLEFILNEGFPVTILTGQMDLTVTLPGVTNMISKLEWAGKAEYTDSERQIWKVGSDVAGYRKTGGNLTFVIIRNAGHLFCGDQMGWCLDFVKNMSNTK